MSISFTYATMGGGKTTELIKTYDIYRRKGLNPIAIKPAIDDREGKQCGWGETKSRITKESIPCFYFTDIKQLETIKLKVGSLFVDEAQFLSKEEVLYLMDYADKKDIPLKAFGLKTDVMVTYLLVLLYGWR